MAGDNIHGSSMVGPTPSGGKNSNNNNKKKKKKKAKNKGPWAGSASSNRPFGNGQPSLDSKLQANAELFRRRIGFVPGIKTIHSGSGPAKVPPNCIILNKKAAPVDGTNGGDGDDGAGPAVAERQLFNEGLLKLSWNKVSPIGAGLRNLGNSCFLNSVLQCLTYTAPLTNLFASGYHRRTCRKPGFCVLCELSNHVDRAISHSKGVVSPKNLAHKLKHIARNLHLGRQEDAHEFLRYVIDGLQNSCLYGYEKLDHLTKQTTMIHAIFAGNMKNTVTCKQCGYVSVTREHIMDLNLEIKHATKLEKALQQYTAAEKLSVDNAYKCDRCKKKVTAMKRMMIERAPNILTIQLKRFSFLNMFGSKINKHVEFPVKLNLAPFMTGRNKGKPCEYTLYAVLVHAGATIQSGHYFSFVKASNGSWYRMDDESVSLVKLSSVLNVKAYMLFYQKTKLDRHTSSAPIVKESLKETTKKSSKSVAESNTQVKEISKTDILGLADVHAAANSSDDEDGNAAVAHGTEASTGPADTINDNDDDNNDEYKVQVNQPVISSHDGWTTTYTGEFDSTEIKDNQVDFGWIVDSFDPSLVMPKYSQSSPCSSESEDSDNHNGKSEDTDDSDSSDDTSNDDDDNVESDSNPKPSSSNRKRIVREVEWDAGIGGDAKKSRTTAFDWDGKIKKKTVIGQLTPSDSLGLNVKTWDSASNTVDSSVIEGDSPANDWEDDEYEEELDRGRIKKVKAKTDAKKVQIKSKNKFQLLHEQQRKAQKQSSSGTGDSHKGQGGGFGRGGSRGRGRGSGRGRGRGGRARGRGRGGKAYKSVSSRV